MDQSNPPKSGFSLPIYNPFEDGFALPRDLNTKLAGYGEPVLPDIDPMAPLREDPKYKEVRYKIRREPRFRDTVKGKLVGVAVGLSLGGCATVPVAHFLSNQITAPTAEGAAPDEEQARNLTALQDAFAKIQAGEARSTVVLDLGHGSYMKKNAEGTLVPNEDPGALVVLTAKDGKVTLRDLAKGEKPSDLGPGEQLIRETDVVEAIGARIALQLIKLGHNVQFTRHIDLEKNPYLKDLGDTERSIIDALNSDIKVLSSRFDARLEQAAKANDGKRPVIYIPLHADKAPTDKRRGAGVFIHPDTPTSSRSYRLAKTLQVAYRDATGGTLGPNVTKGVIPGQKGFGALFTPECTPEIGLGTRTVTIIDPDRGLDQITTTLVEAGYLSNASDTYRLRNREWANNFARVTAEGIDMFFAREYEGDKAPLKPSTITVNGKQVHVVPNDPAAAAKLARDLANSIPADKTDKTVIRTRVVQRCKPSGDKYDVRIAELAPMPPKIAPAASQLSAAQKPALEQPSTTVTAAKKVVAPKAAKPEKPAKATPTQSRKPTDFATSNDKPRTRS